ncbi:hypothetical protein GR204_02585 [Rhizobium leguminosarum]|uniref:Integral membrane protein n=1 Tax=Rhizobium leguminosarum TaxID=384 RepID=A0A6P0B1G6_RHILE|nr:hypothetical protein [Rhizobium leguminosarum]NEI32901.1 hypothetical protein [Rhizobium leguminosarum]NEI39660.1 hypothetical protein [Rhizobium leguminosarum]
MFSAEKYLDAGGVVGGTIILLLVLLCLIIQEVREIIFYKRNNLNFDLDSNIGGKMYKGDSTDDKDLVTNKSRVCYGAPFMISVVAIQLIACVAIILSK